MPEIEPQATFNYYQGTDGPTLMIKMYEEAQILGLKAIFLRLAQGAATRVSLRATGIVNMVDAVDDLVLVRFQNKEEPSRTVRKVSNSLKGPLFEFRRHPDGWHECAELLDGLRGPAIST